MSIMKHAKHFLALTMLLGVGSMVGSSDAMAQARPTPVKHSSPAPATGKVSLSLKVIHANNSGTIDPQLRGVVDNLKFTRFSGFSLLNNHNAKLGPNQDETFNIVGGRRVKVTLVSRDARAAKVRVVMHNAQGKVMDTTVSIHRNRAFMIAGPSHDGGKLVLPLSVQY